MTKAATRNQTVFHETKSNQEVEPWKGICSARCYSAKTERKKCKCRCHGEHHGRYRLDKLKEKSIEGFF